MPVFNPGEITRLINGMSTQQKADLVVALALNYLNQTQVDARIQAYGSPFTSDEKTMLATLTEALVGATLSGNVLTLTRQDGENPVSITLPQTEQSMADGVINAATLDPATQVLTLTPSQGSAITVSLALFTTNAEVNSLIQAYGSPFTAAEKTKLGDIEALADVTDNANVLAALQAFTDAQKTQGKTALDVDEVDSANVLAALQAFSEQQQGEARAAIGALDASHAHSVEGGRIATSGVLPTAAGTPAVTIGANWGLNTDTDALNGVTRSANGNVLRIPRNVYDNDHSGLVVKALVGTSIEGIQSYMSGPESGMPTDLSLAYSGKPLMFSDNQYIMIDYFIGASGGTSFRLINSGTTLPANSTVQIFWRAS